VLEINAFVFEFVDPVFVLFAFTNKLAVLSIQTLDLFSELAILLLKFSYCAGLFVCSFLVGSEVVLQLKMCILGRIMDLCQRCKLLLELLNLLSVVALLCLSHLCLQ